MNIVEIRDLLKMFQPLERFSEVTLEANPDDITPEKLAAWKSLGIHRFSLGIQSFQQKHLDWMNRAHTAEESHSSLRQIFDAGYENVSIDLIYGMAEQSLEDWKIELETAFQYPITHLSTYQLTVEEKTALGHDIGNGKYTMPNDELVVAEYDLLMDWMEENEWEHYEISNSARKGCRAIHNSQYWDRTEYIGLGPGAHSWDGRHRSWNLPHNHKYMQAIKEGKRTVESEFIEDKTRYNEWLMTGLRRVEGIRFSDLNRFPAYLQLYFKNAVQGYRKNELVQMNPSSMFLTRKGKHYADKIASDLMYV